MKKQGERQARGEKVLVAGTEKGLGQEKGKGKGKGSEGLWAAQVAQKKAKIILTLIFFVFEINFLPFLLPLSVPLPSFILHCALI